MNAGKNISPQRSLLLIKWLHTIVWLFYNIVIAYLFYAIVLKNKIDIWVWVCIALFAIEGIILVVFKMICPLTIWARRYSDSTKHNFDIFLPEWLAKNNKLIYTSFLGIILTILLYRLLTN